MNYKEKKELALQVPIRDILAHYNIIVTDNKKVCRSPFRDDHGPSFHIYDDNHWVDYGSTDGHIRGDSINLVEKIEGLDFKQAVDLILRISGNPFANDGSDIPVCTPRRHTAQREEDKQSGQAMQRIDQVIDVRHPALLNYARSRCIPPNVLRRYCKEVHYTYLPKNSHLFGIGFRNDEGGWVVRTAPYAGNPKGNKIDVIASGMSTIPCNGGSDTAYVFEGFFNFLSWVVIYGTPDRDIYVLNGKENAKKLAGCASRGVRVLYFYVDNDTAGREAFDTLSRLAGCTVEDVSDFYRGEGLDDLNDYLRAHPETARKET